MKKIESLPQAKLLLASLRSVGYSDQTAIADIIDNSITANATEIRIEYDWPKKSISIIDDGYGMGFDELIENMRIGSSDPEKVRDDTDLGRFGMGMKTAAFALARRLTVITKKDCVLSNAVWDLDMIPDIGWNLLCMENDELLYYSEKIKGEQGTIIILEKLDRVITEENEEKAKQQFYRSLSTVEKHLGITFHRFIEEDGLVIKANGNIIEPWNPFVLDNKATQEFDEEEIYSEDESKRIVIQPFILPHKTKFDTEEDFKKAAGPGDWRANQGLYVYRNRRLLVHGTWFSYIKKEPAFNLARIRVDITSDSDEDWKIDIKKSTATPPHYARDRIRSIIDDYTIKSAKVYNSRGSYTSHNNDSSNLDYVWEQHRNRGKYYYKINRNHPILQRVFAKLDKDRNLLDSYLVLIENYAPCMVSGVVETMGSSTPNKTVDKVSLIKARKELQDLVDAYMFMGYSKKEIDSAISAMPEYIDYIDELKEILEKSK